jgi:hypothetical protein
LSTSAGGLRYDWLHAVTPIAWIDFAGRGAVPASLLHGTFQHPASAMRAMTPFWYLMSPGCLSASSSSIVQRLFLAARPHEDALEVLPYLLILG